MLTSEVIQNYENHLREKGYSEITIPNYAGDVLRFLKHIDPGCEKKQFSPPTTEQYYKYRDKMIEKGLIPATIDRRLTAISQFLKWAKSMGLADENYKDLEKLAYVDLTNIINNQKRIATNLREKIEKSVKEYINRENINTTNNLEYELRNIVIILLLINGVTVDEIMNLRMKDLVIFTSDGGEELIEIRYEESPTQNKRYLSGDTAKYLNLYLKTRKYSESPYVFLAVSAARANARIGIRTIERAVKQFTGKSTAKLSLRRIEKIIFRKY